MALRASQDIGFQTTFFQRFEGRLKRPSYQ